MKRRRRKVIKVKENKKERSDRSRIFEKKKKSNRSRVIKRREVIEVG